MRAELYRRTPQDHSHCYKAEAELPYVIFFLIKLSWLEERDLGVLSRIHLDFEVMITSIPRLLKVDFTSLKNPVMDYASHTSIAPARVRMLTACAVHYDLDFGLVTRYLGGEYTAEWRDINKIISTCEPFVTPEVLGQMERILTTGCPSYLNWEEDAANKRGATSPPSHSTVTWSQKHSQKRSAIATSSLWSDWFAHAYHGVGTSLRISKSSPKRSPN